MSNLLRIQKSSHMYKSPFHILEKGRCICGQENPTLGLLSALLWTHTERTEVFVLPCVSSPEAGCGREPGRPQMNTSAKRLRPWSHLPSHRTVPYCPLLATSWKNVCLFTSSATQMFKCVEGDLWNTTASFALVHTEHFLLSSHSR